MPGPSLLIARLAFRFALPFGVFGALLAAPAAQGLDDAVHAYRRPPPALGADTLTVAVPLWRAAPVPHTGRTVAVGGAGAGSLGYEWVRRRHLDPRPGAPFTVEFDWDYARWADKAGHAFSTGVQAELWATAYRWAGHDEQAAALLGAATGFAGMLWYETLDGFDRGVGFSPPDLAANGLGAGLVAARAYWPALDAVRLKWSYWPSGSSCDPSCDYEGQTAWLAVNPHALAPEAARRYLPPWLNVAAGYGARDGGVQTGFEASVFYLGLDFEPAGLPLSGPVWERLLPFLRLIHLPAPALRFDGDGVAFEPLAY